MTNLRDEIWIDVLKENLKHSAHPLSAHALLSFEELEFRTLSGRWLGGACRGHAEFIVHNLLDVAKKREIFGSPYELGNPDILDKKAVRQGPLIAHLETIRPLAGGSELNNIESVLKALKRVVKDLTGHEFRSFTSSTSNLVQDSLNYSYAIKALCTLYRYRMWEPKIFNRFAKPKQSRNFSLELRDAHPLHWKDDSARNGVAIYSDLKQSLTFGMSKDEVNILLPAMRQLSERYAQSQFASPQVLTWCLANSESNHFFRQKDDIISLLPLGKSPRTNRLDIDLHIGLTLRELDIRLLGKDAINRLLISDEAKVPTCPEWSSQKLMAVICAISKKNISAFKVELQRLLDCEFSENEFEAVLDRYLKLTWIVKSPLDKDVSFTHLETLAAIIACIGEAAESVRTKAYWYAKKTSSDNPMFYLDNIENFTSVSRIPEHYLEYWFRRFMLVMSRLVGREDLWHYQNTLEQFEGYRVIDVFRTHDAFNAARIVTAYFDKTPNLVDMQAFKQ
ncbi:hypothetical protein H1D31_16105 [Alishewanella sp. BS5-314]|uniref:hypothetical protein n=1 Tax=Alishewanella sp. BS5-314 TaxID=2755587 RepID=UPI0021BA63FE|nr:hypothetical protein [Alishewanella sp. BS5-314]MCT8127534.1 hypothetical protein [Alishewanella sp. BS5-314]